MKIHYAAVSLPAEKSLGAKFNSSATDLKDKRNFVLHFKYGPKKDSLYCPLDDLRVVHVEKLGHMWQARITLDGEICVVGKTQKKLSAWGENWTIAVCRVLAIPQFFHKPSHQWLSWFDLCENKPFLLHPKSNNKSPKKCWNFHPTQEWLDSLSQILPERKPIPTPPKAKTFAQPKKRKVSSGKKVSQQLRGIGLTREESELPQKEKDELLLRRVLSA